MSKRIETQNSVEREKKDGNTSGGIYTDIAAMEIENGGGGGGEDIGTDPKMTPIKSAIKNLKDFSVAKSFLTKSFSASSISPE